MGRETGTMQDRFLPLTITETFPLYIRAVGNVQLIMHLKIHFGLRSPVSLAF